MVEPTTLRSSSVSAVRRETSSPLRLRSKNAWSSPTRCEYRRSRRSATTRSPSSETKKKRAAVASASASATANTSAKVALMLPPPEKPWSIIRRTTSGRLRVAVLDAASDTSQRSEEHTSELPSLMRISYAVFCLKKKKKTTNNKSKK